MRKLASLKVTLSGMALLAVAAGLSYGNPEDMPVWVLVVPMALLAVNLSAAIATNPKINQQPGLLIFHVSLLAIMVLAAIGQLTHLDAHLEIVVGTEFTPQQLLEVNAGPLHHGDLQNVHFVQGPFTVEYAAGMQRGLTRSQVKFKDNDGQWIDKTVGDDRPLVLHGYRFYTTYNKGFATLLTWTALDGHTVTGTVNMPSYPLFEYKQDNRWSPPGSAQEIKFWLQVKTAMRDDAPWVLDGRDASGVLVVSTQGRRVELRPGQSTRINDGELRFDALSMWMGYRLFYDPTIKWLFFVAVTGVLGLAQYFWVKVNLQPWLQELDEADSTTPTKPDPGETETGERVPRNRDWQEV